MNSTTSSQLGLTVYVEPRDEGWEEAWLKANFDYSYGSLGLPHIFAQWDTIKWDLNNPTHLAILTALADFFAKTEGVERAIGYTNTKGVYVANYWDGYGSTVIWHDEGVHVNKDSKKPYGWEYYYHSDKKWWDKLRENYYYE